MYKSWESSFAILSELYRNIGMAVVAVFIITLIMLSDLRLCLMVLMSIIFTLVSQLEKEELSATFNWVSHFLQVDCAGFYYLWGEKIDLASATDLVLVVGLCVDYTAHIAQAYKFAEPSDELNRAGAALLDIGPAILNGGVTTVLALVLLSTASSHVFRVFFKVFTLSAIFGLFHGLVFIPVMLSVLFRDSGEGRTERAKKMQRA